MNITKYDLLEVIKDISGNKSRREIIYDVESPLTFLKYLDKFV